MWRFTPIALPPYSYIPKARLGTQTSDWPTGYDVVFDPFCGGAVTLCSCRDHGRKRIGIDISPKAAQLMRPVASKQTRPDCPGGGGGGARYADRVEADHALGCHSLYGVTQCVHGAECGLACSEVCGWGHLFGDHDPDRFPVAVGRIDSLVGRERHCGLSYVFHFLFELVNITGWFVELGDLSADGACGHRHVGVFGFNYEYD